MRLRPRVRLWMKLAAVVALAVAATHAVHLVMGNRIVGRALSREQEALGRSTGRLIAHEAADLVLIGDVVSLHELVSQCVTKDGIAYCLVTRGDQVLASSSAAGAPPALVRARAAGDHATLVIRSGAERYLEVAEPILEGAAGTVRVGLDMRPIQRTRQAVAVRLGLIASGVILAGLLAAFLLGRGIARPVAELLRAVDRYEPASELRPIAPRGSDEIAELTERFNRMMERLKTAHDEQVRARDKHATTERLAALGTLVAGVAHEVNNPLAGMKNCVRRLERADLSPEKHREYLELMAEGLGRLEDVMRGLLDFGRPRPVSLAAVGVRDLVHEGARFIRPYLRRHRIECAEELDDSVVVADRGQIGQALLNLLLNAMYVTSEGGELKIRVRHRPGMTGLAVEDGGPGVPSEIRARVFDPFFSTKPEGEGTGLGLTVSRAIVDAHGGEMTLECPEHGGTVATIWLRDAAAAPGAIEA